MTLKTTKMRLALAAFCSLAIAGSLSFAPTAPSAAAISPTGEGGVHLLAQHANSQVVVDGQATQPRASGTGPGQAPGGNRFLRSTPGAVGVTAGPIGPFQGRYALTCWQNGQKIIDSAPVEAPIAGRLANRDSAYFGQNQQDAQILIMRGENLCLASRP